MDSAAGSPVVLEAWEDSTGMGAGLGVELLGPAISPCLTVRGAARLFSKVGTAVCEGSVSPRRAALRFPRPCMFL